VKNKQINIRVNKSILDTLELKSKALNMNKSEYIIKAIIDSDIKVYNDRYDLDVINNLNRIGNNVNQIARNMNIARNANKLDDVNYISILDMLTIIQYRLDNIC